VITISVSTHEAVAKQFVRTILVDEARWTVVSITALLGGAAMRVVDVGAVFIVAEQTLVVPVNGVASADIGVAVALRNTAHVMIGSRAASVFTHDVRVIRIQYIARRTVVDAAHAHFVAAGMQVEVRAHSLFAELDARIELRDVSHGTPVGVAAIGLCAALFGWRSCRIAVHVFAVDLMGIGFQYPVFWTFVASALSILETAEILVAGRAGRALAEEIRCIVQFLVILRTVEAGACGG
jgi:hypothetical protein